MNIKSFLVIILFHSALLAVEYHVLPSEKNLVKFISDAPIEDFEGITHAIDGYIYWEDDDMLKNSEVYFEVDLNSIDTGIGLRNRHMRENYLETDHFPITYFKGKIIKAVQTNENEFEVLVQGKMFIHGVERLKSIKGTMQAVGDTYRIQSAFDVKLSDYKIAIPSIMFYKIDETMKLVVDFWIEKFEETSRIGSEIEGNHDEN